MFDRIQTLFERFVGVQGSISVPMSAFRPRAGLPAQSAHPACWRRSKRVTAWHAEPMRTFSDGRIQQDAG